MIALCVISVVLIIIAAVAFVPIPVTVNLTDRHLRIRLWFVTVLDSGKRRKNKSKPEKSCEQDNKESGSAKKKTSPENIIKRIEAARQLFRENKALIGKVLGTVRIGYYRAVVTVGADDPAVTGILTGSAGALASEADIALKNIFPQAKESYISAVPNFNEPMLKAAAEVRVKISVFRLIIAAVSIVKAYRANKDKLDFIMGGEENS